MLGEEQLACEACGEASVVTFWRFEGLSDPPAGCAGEAQTYRSPVNS
jgi:hypothetical protein